MELDIPDSTNVELFQNNLRKYRILKVGYHREIARRLFMNFTTIEQRRLVPKLCKNVKGKITVDINISYTEKSGKISGGARIVEQVGPTAGPQVYDRASECLG